MVRIKAALHEHLKTSSKIEGLSFNRVVDLARSRLGAECLFSVVDFDDMRYKSFISKQGYEREYIGEDRRGVRIFDQVRRLEVACVHGEEVPTKQGHLLVLGLGYETHLKHGRQFEETIKEARDYNPNAVIICDHPFHNSGVGDYLRDHREVMGGIDAFEENGEACFGLPFSPFPLGANRKVREFYREVCSDFPHLGFIRSQDGHSLYEFCEGWSEIEKPFLLFPELFSSSFRESVQGTSLDTNGKVNQVRGILGAIDHVRNLAWILKIAPKIGLEHRYEVERPDNK